MMYSQIQENETLRGLSDRKSIRQFTNRPITDAEKRVILHAAAQAPTAGNQMLYTILDVTDPALKEKLAHSCDEQPFIAQAPLVLIFLADCQRWLDAYHLAGCSPRAPGYGDLLLAVADACIAAQNAVTAAWSIGIGSCYIGDILENAEYHREILRLSDFVMPAAMVVFGYPTEKQLARKKPTRFSLKQIVRENYYRPLKPEEQHCLFAQRSEQADTFDFNAYIAAFCKRKYNSDFSREMTRSAEIYLDAFQRK